jgi:hypothetical protein
VKKYIVSPRYDWAFFLAPPLVALLVGILISGTGFSEDVFLVGAEEETWAGLLLGTIIHAHLVAVFVRSHANGDIRRRHPIRFLVVPVLLWIALIASDLALALAIVVASVWDVYHSGAQTFGLGRIYDRNLGNPPELGRRLDFWLNQLLYAGPILGGITLVDQLDSLHELESFGGAFFHEAPAAASGFQRTLAWIVLVAGALFLAVYVLVYAHYRKRGYKVSPLKLFLVVSTGACSIYTWGFNSWGEAFFIMNLFHAVQYLALVWAMESKTLEKRYRWGRPWLLAAYLGTLLLYGVGAELVDADVRVVVALTLVVSLMHFWYDGFIWSVRRHQV